ncbi:MAG: adenylosuccinate lyase [Spirochaetia bacterium]|nr:adenylosuccinate lyase [Spirochaetia bacterium]
MIKRYTLEKMGSLWTEDAKFRSWLDVELAVCEAWAKKGKIPAENMAAIRKKADFDVAEIEKIEQRTHHDLIAFTESVANHVGVSSRYIHMGITSSDVVDTGFALRMVRACDIIMEDTKALIKTLKKLAVKHKYTVQIGRTHNVHAEPITFGLKVLVWYFEMKRNLERLEAGKEGIRVGKLSGAVGNYANIPPEIEKMAMDKLKLKRAEIANQVIQRDRYAYLMTNMAIAAGSIEKIATEIRNLQHTEILEVEEPFAKGQKGSSAMPHKRNPVVCEQITGLARVIRSNSMAALENISLWHERDISHSSVERIIVPDTFILLDYIINKINWVLEGMQVYPTNMKRNLHYLKGAIFSQRLLLALVQKGLSREKSYEIVQSNAMRVWKGESPDFITALLADPDIKKHFQAKELDDIFDVNYYLKYVDEFFERAK